MGQDGEQDDLERAWLAYVAAREAMLARRAEGEQATSQRDHRDGQRRTSHIDIRDAIPTARRSP
jgi:hypothetical protein